MTARREEHRVGLAYLAAVTELLQRIRGQHPTAGLYEAADFQWRWRQPRSTDDLPQLFWFDDGRPVAAVVVTDEGGHVTVDPLVLPDAEPGWLEHVMGRGLAVAEEQGFGIVELEVDRGDGVLQRFLVDHGFAPAEGEYVETWMDASARPAARPLPGGYRLTDRAATLDRPHHHGGRLHPDGEARLRQTSLYRPDLDLVVLDAADAVAAYGLFWFEPVTATGLVEPMRTEEDHQRRGLARHVLTAGVDRLAAAGAERIKVCFEPDNPASGHLYRSAGFVPDRQTAVFTNRR